MTYRIRLDNFTVEMDGVDDVMRLMDAMGSSAQTVPIKDDPLVTVPAKPAKPAKKPSRKAAADRAFASRVKADQIWKGSNGKVIRITGVTSSLVMVDTIQPSAGSSSSLNKSISIGTLRANYSRVLDQKDQGNGSVLRSGMKFRPKTREGPGIEIGEIHGNPAVSATRISVKRNGGPQTKMTIASLRNNYRPDTVTS